MYVALPDAPPAAGTVLSPEMCAPGGHGLAHDSQPAGQVTMVSQFETAPPVATGALVTAYVGGCVGVMAPTDWEATPYVAGVWYCPEPAVVLVAC